jgi:hypothetical protein
MHSLRFTLVGMVLAIGPSIAAAQSQSFPNAWGSTGQYNGTVDRKGNLYGPDGRFMGRIDQPGAYARPGDDAFGRGSTPRFRTTPRAPSGNQAIYGANGQYMGYVDRNGDLFDSKGTFRGRIR